MSVVLEVAIGLILMYLVLSLIVSAVNEFLAGLTDRRADFLRKGLENMLGQALTGRLYQHGLIRGLVRRNSLAHRSPSYLSSSTFSAALMDLLSRIQIPAQPATSSETELLQARLANLSSEAGGQVPALNIGPLSVEDAQAHGDLKEALSVFASDAADLAQVKERVEAWFDEAMDRVSGWYRRRTRAVLLVVGAILVGWLNADTVTVAQQLWIDPSVRGAALAAAQDVIAQESADASTPTPPVPGAEPVPPVKPAADLEPAEAAESAAEAIGDLEEIGLPLGWSPEQRPTGTWAWALKALGLLLTTLAVSFGATFWFDLLKRLVGLRASGPPPPEANGTTGT